jgi:glutamate--cysteine ligase
MWASAFWVGLLYHGPSLDAAWALVETWSAQERERMRADVPRLALDTPVPGGRTLRDVARDALALSRAGLRARGLRDGAGQDETRFLDPLDAIADSGRTLAHHLLDLFHGPWGGSVEPAFRDCVF